MTWQLWIIFALFIVNAVSQSAVVGKPRKPTEPGVAVGIAATNLIFAGLVLWGAS